MDPIEAYLSGLPAEQRVALERLRGEIRAAAPGTEERIGYGVPAFYLGGRALVSYGAARDHCSLFVQSPAVIDAHREVLAGRRVTRGSVQFTPGDPLPSALVAMLVRARITEVSAARQGR